MKSLVLKYFSARCFVGALSLALVIAEAKTQEEKCEELYQKWHVVLKANPFVTEPMYFKTNADGVKRLEDLADVVNKINANRISMALFLCKKMASETPYQDQDIDLLDHVAGINLWFADRPNDHIAQEIHKNLARFREEWRAGVYEDPSNRVRQLFEHIRSKEEEVSIDPRNLAPIRRYGIFALPELTRQIKKYNSKQAFAAYLVIVNHLREYREYLGNSQQQFTTVEAKLSHVRQELVKMSAEVGNDFDLIKKISSAIKE